MSNPYGYHNNGNNQGYPPQGPPRGGEAASYYESSQYPPPQYTQGQGQHQQQYGQQQYGQQQYGQQGPQQYPPQAGFQPDGPDGERGVLGAIGGGIAGGVGGNAIGNKTNHSKLGTILGVVGGAIAGHKLQDGVSDWNDNRKDKKEEEERHKREEEDRRRREEEDRNRRRHSGSHSPPRHHSPPRQHYDEKRDCAPGVNYQGNYSGSSRDARVDCRGKDYTLHASCRRRDGSYQSSSIDLDKYLSNDRGSFRWVNPSSGGSQQRQITVQPGDTLRAIAGRVGTSFEEIARHNHIQNPDLIYPGQVLNVPGQGGRCGGGDVGNFGQSARNVRLVEGGRRLEAELLRDGQWVGSSIVLDERIGNDNGCLVFKS